MMYKMPWLKVVLVPVVCACLLLGAFLASNPADAQPFAYVSGVVASGPDYVPLTVVIDPATDAVVDTVPAGTGGIAITPDGTRAYVVSGTNAVAVIDTTTRTVIATVTVDAGTNSGGGIAITPEGTRAYVVPPDHQLRYDVSVIDTDPGSSTYNMVIATVTVGTTPFGVAITPNGTRAYVGNIRDGTVSVIDPNSSTYNTVVGLVTLSPGVTGIAISPDGRRAYVASDGDCCPNYLTVIDTATNTITARVEVRGHSVGVALTPDGAFAYVGNRGSSGYYGDPTVSVIDTTSNTVVATVDFRTANFYCLPFGLAITPGGTQAYVPCQKAGGAPTSGVIVIDTMTNNVVDQIVTGQDSSNWVAFTLF